MKSLFLVVQLWHHFSGHQTMPPILEQGARDWKSFRGKQLMVELGSQGRSDFSIVSSSYFLYGKNNSRINRPAYKCTTKVNPSSQFGLLYFYFHLSAVMNISTWLEIVTGCVLGLVLIKLIQPRTHAWYNLEPPNCIIVWVCQS